MGAEIVPNDDYVVIKTALAKGRDGTATLTLLAKAHEFASARNMYDTIKELRQHIYKLLPYPQRDPFSRKAIAMMLMMGVVSAVGVGLILKHTGIREKLLR